MQAENRSQNVARKSRVTPSKIHTHTHTHTYKILSYTCLYNTAPWSVALSYRTASEWHRIKSENNCARHCDAVSAISHTVQCTGCGRKKWTPKFFRCFLSNRLRL